MDPTDLRADGGSVETTFLREPAVLGPETDLPHDEPIDVRIRQHTVRMLERKLPDCRGNATVSMRSAFLDFALMASTVRNGD